MTDAAHEQAKDFGSQMQELEAMKVIARELSKLDPLGVGRVLRWAAEAFGTKATVSAAVSAAQPGPGAAPGGQLKLKYESLADFYAAASPNQVNDKALVVGYWFQIMQELGDFDAQSVNKELKHLGHGAANITSAFDSLMARKPQLVLQTKKSGTTKQARKMYRLTLEGQRAVERMLSGNEQQ